MALGPSGEDDGRGGLAAPEPGSDEINQQNSALSGAMPFGIAPPIFMGDSGDSGDGSDGRRGVGAIFGGGGGTAPEGALDYSGGHYQYPSNWRDFPDTFFNWGDRGRQYENALKSVYARDPDAAKSQEFLNAHQNPTLSQYSGADLPSTNDYRALPAPYNRPGFIMQNGRIINTALSNPQTYLQSLGYNFGSAMDGSGGWRGGLSQNRGSSASQGGSELPYSLNYGKGGQLQFWPGDVMGREAMLPTSFETT